MPDTRVAPKEENVYLFSGLVFCGDCKQNMVRNSVCRNGKTYVYYICGNNRTNKACSSHRISEAALGKAVFLSLKEHIANILNVERILQYIETLPIHQEEVQKTDTQLIKKQEEISRYGRLKTALYESLADGLIDKAEYLELKSGYDLKIADAQAASEKLKAELECLLQNRTGTSLWIEQFKKYRNITELTRHIAVMLIDRIIVFEDCRIDIRFRYQYDYERALELIRNMQKFCPEKAASYEKEAV